MATTGAVIQLLASGVINTSTGAALASGRARFYQPGTLVAQNVYSDDACSTAITQPYTLGSGGEAKLFMLDPVRIIVKDSSDTTTHLDTVVVQRHDHQFITHASFNGGAETTLEALLTTLASSVGANFQYKESSTATSRNYQAWLANTYVSVLDFAADPTGVSDSATAIGNAITEAIDNGCKRVYIDPGTYRIDSAITAIDTAGVEIFGAGRGQSIIKNHSTSANAFTINISGDSKLYMHDFAITANTTSSGAAISVTSGDQCVFERIGFLLHRSALVASAVNGAQAIRCVVGSTDDNGSSVGINVGTRGVVDSCEVANGTDNGTGITLGAVARCTNCYTNNWATAILMSGVIARVSGAYVNGPTTGISVTGQDGDITHSYVTAATTGVSLGATQTGVKFSAITSCTTAVSVGAFARCYVQFCDGSSNTTGVSVNASATLLREFGNNLGTLSDSATTPHSWLSARPKVLSKTKETFNAATPTFTPTPATCDIFIAELTYAVGNTTATIAATSTTGLVNGQMFYLVLYKNGANNWTATTFNAQYANGVAAPNIADGTWASYAFQWQSSISKWVCLHHSATAAFGGTAGTTYW